IDLRLTTDNYAAFAENIFQVSTKFSVVPGIRYEIINTHLSGVIKNATTNVAYRGKRTFPLLGLGLQYQATSTTQLYANIAQAYRPYLYANVTPADRVDKIDPNLKDSKGYDVDLGYRGRLLNILQFDLDAFYLFYGDRIGLVSETNAAGTNLLTTNIGNSRSIGIEAFAELSLLKLLHYKDANTDVRVFTSLSYDDAKYISGFVNKAGTNIKIAGNDVENAPKWISKSGLELRYKKLFTNFQYSYTSKSFNDAFNTIRSTNGVTGLIPAYHVLDWNVNWQFTKQFHISANVNNLANEKYFNRRTTFYPGPGILSADGRTFVISFGINL
ncbi:MAG TPA: TonB-dependent receptor, partial [Chitinophagaceae bacterium]|nr:TonB-dependent receptor [Chitinophagaceae bacterium]